MRYKLLMHGQTKFQNLCLDNNEKKKKSELVCEATKRLPGPRHGPHALGEPSQPDERGTLLNSQLRACTVREILRTVKRKWGCDLGALWFHGLDFPTPPRSLAGCPAAAGTTLLSGDVSGPLPPSPGPRGRQELLPVRAGVTKVSFLGSPPFSRLLFSLSSIRFFCARPPLPQIFKVCQEEVKTEREFYDMNCYASCFC